MRSTALRVRLSLNTVVVHGTVTLVFLPSALFPLAALVIGLRNPIIFQAPSLFSNSPFLVILFLIIIGALLFLSRRSSLLRENISGLVLFFLFTTGYFLLATIFNKPDINTNNIYFAADSWSWLQRIAFEDGWTMTTRAVHPLTPLIFRPLTSLLALFAGGDRYQAGLAFLALTGGGCVFVTWKIVRLVSEDSNHAVLVASLLGLSASHLIFASVIESYIFSALFLLLFVWLLLADKSVYLVIATGVLTLGVTVTNFAQQALTALFLRKDLKRLIIIFSCIVLVSVGLNIISHAIYPVPYFFLPQNLFEEQSYLRELSLKRTGLMVEDLLIYNIAAPQPNVSMRREMPRFNFLQGAFKDYAWFGLPALILWIGILALGFFYFIKNIRSDSNDKFLALSMLICLIFNLLLHIRYGVEPFLYSADWTYALILFVAVSLNGLVGRAWFKGLTFLLVISVFINNMGFLYIIARKVSEHLL
jgi:hypothetical protein